MITINLHHPPYQNLFRKTRNLSKQQKFVPGIKRLITVFACCRKKFLRFSLSELSKAHIWRPATLDFLENGQRHVPEKVKENSI
jgi:hypothetical protein